MLVRSGWGFGQQRRREHVQEVAKIGSCRVVCLTSHLQRRAPRWVRVGKALDQVGETLMLNLLTQNMVFYWDYDDRFKPSTD